VAPPAAGQGEDDQDEPERGHDLGEEVGGVAGDGEIEMAALENIRLATTAPPTQPSTWAGRYAPASRQLIPSKAASTIETTG